MTETTCSDCGEVLPAEPRAPCPVCGSERRNIRVLVEAGALTFAGGTANVVVSPATIEMKAQVSAPTILTERKPAAHFEFQLYYYPPEDSGALGLVRIDGIEHEPTEFIFGKSAVEVAQRLAEWFEDGC